MTSKALRSPPWHGWPLWNICVTNDNGYVRLVVNTSWSFPHSWLITGFVTRLTRPVLLVEQELLTLPEHLSFSGVRDTESFFLWPFCCLFFFDIRILITPLISSNSSYIRWRPNTRINTMSNNALTFKHVER